MKRVFMSLLVVSASLAACGMAATAQAGQGSGFGVVAGYNASTFGGDDADIGYLTLEIDGSLYDIDFSSPDARSGFTFGVCRETELSPEMVVHAALLYSMCGTKYSGRFVDYYDVSIDMTYKVDYLELPLMLRFKPGSGATRLFLDAGFCPALKLAAEVEVEASGGGDSFTTSEDISDVFQTFNLSAMVGAGVSINDRFQLGVHYKPGLMSVSESDVEDIKINQLALTAAMMF